MGMGCGGVIVVVQDAGYEDFHRHNTPDAADGTAGSVGSVTVQFSPTSTGCDAALLTSPDRPGVQFGVAGIVSGKFTENGCELGPQPTFAVNVVAGRLTVFPVSLTTVLVTFRVAGGQINWF
jgi:hypothetical protein